MTLLAAFQVLLSRYTGQEDIAVGSPIAGRTRDRGLIGFFVNTLVLRSDLRQSGVSRAARAGAQSALEHTHQDVPFEKLVKACAQRDLSRNPLFQVMFALQNAPGSRWHSACR
jgi:non-ribosomal peptide synthetase component F